MSTDAMDAAKIVQDALEDKLAEDIRMLDLRGLSNIADCFVIARRWFTFFPLAITKQSAILESPRRSSKIGRASCRERV